MNQTQIVRRTRRSQTRESGRSPGASRTEVAPSPLDASPVVGGLPLLRTSERSTFKRCRWKWFMEFEETLKPKTAVPPLRFGSLIHMALADYYKKGVKRGPHPAKQFAMYYEREKASQEPFGFRVHDLEEDEVWAEAGPLGEAMLNHYVEQWGKDDQWEVLVTEQPFRQLVYHPATHKPLFWAVGVMDLVVRDLITKRIHIVDHKTAKAIQVQYLSLDAQATAYWTWGLDWIYDQGLLKPNQRPAGMIYNHLRKAFPDDRPKDAGGFSLNRDGSVSKKQPAPYFSRTPIFRDWNERDRARYQIISEFFDMEQVRKSERLEGPTAPPEGAYKNNGQFTCPGCWCFDFCELNEMGADWEEMRSLIVKEWDPYAEHETYASETR